MTNSARHRETTNATRIAAWLADRNIGNGKPLSVVSAAALARDAFVPGLNIMRESGIAWHLVAEILNRRTPTAQRVNAAYRGRMDAAHPSFRDGFMSRFECSCQTA
jgi:hypothetical protein